MLSDDRDWRGSENWSSVEGFTCLPANGCFTQKDGAKEDTLVCITTFLKRYLGWWSLSPLLQRDCANVSSP